MGIYHTFPGLEPGIELNQQPGIRQEMNGEEQPEILRLINSIYFFIECVFIMKEKNKYRLVVLHHRMVLCDKKYPTLIGCKIAFSRMFKKKVWKKNVIPDWSQEYIPESKWLADKSSYWEAFHEG